MKCPNCQHSNDISAKFCEECAAPLRRTCTRCGHQLSPTAKFCPECAQPAGADAQSLFGAPEAYTPRHLAQKILNTRNALEGERKQVTVLFADLKGSMEMLADRDPEEARRILDPVLEYMMEAVHYYEGTVSLVMGDGIMAIFGAPLAHEDHAVRACYAALRMQDTVKRHAEGVLNTHGVNVQIRIGLNSGEVVVRAIGSDLHMDYTAIGRTTHLAARMEQLASPGSILLTPSTLELVEGFVAARSLGAVPIKGLEQALDVHEVTGLGADRTRFKAVARRGLTRFLGRDAEMDELNQAQQLTSDGCGQVIALIAEAGVGKSRLVHEFAHSPELQDWLVLECTAVSYGKAMSYLPVIDLLRSYFGTQDKDDLKEIGDKVAGKVLALDKALEPTLPALLSMLDVPLDPSVGSAQAAAWLALAPAQRRRQILDAVRSLLLREARQQPLLLVFEDLHWIDGETQALLDDLVDCLSSAHILLLATYRPEYQHSWGSKRHYGQMRLDALPAESARKLLDALLGDDAALAPLKQLLVKRGNPFFLEETVRTLVETKVLEGSPADYRLIRPVEVIQVPATVQVMLAARIDRLPLEAKRLLQIASVIGKRVPFTLLQAISEIPDAALLEGLDLLQAAEFVYDAGLVPDREYTFKHALTHDVAYGSLLHERRRELHASIVDAIKNLHSDRLGEHIEELAHHALRGELREEAVSYLRQAALKSVDRSALRDAKTWFEQALSLLQSLPETQALQTLAFEIRLELRPVMMQLSEARQMVQRLREAEILAERLNDNRMRVRAGSFLTSIQAFLGELDKSLASGTRALEIAERLRDWKLKMLAEVSLGQVHYLRGDYVEAVELLTDSIAMIPAASIYERFEFTGAATVFNRYWLIVSLAQLGSFVDATIHETEAIRLAVSSRHAYTACLAHFAASRLHLLKGNWSNPAFEHAIAALQAANIPTLYPYAVSEATWPLAQLGKVGAALDLVRQGEQLLQRQVETGYVSQCSWAYHVLGRACLLLDQRDEAQRLACRAIELASHQPGFAAHALHLLGDIATRPERFDPAEGEAKHRKALSIAKQRGMRPLAAHCHFALGKLYQRTSRNEQALEHLTTATKMYRELDMRFYLDRAEAVQVG